MTMPAVQVPVRAERIALSCGRCEGRATTFGRCAEQLASVWAAAHLDPHIDSLDVVAAFTGESLGVWRRRL